ncbi:unnamed protein product, partial [Ceratitis capitata]
AEDVNACWSWPANWGMTNLRFADVVDANISPAEYVLGGAERLRCRAAPDSTKQPEEMLTIICIADFSTLKYFGGFSPIFIAA